MTTLIRLSAKGQLVIPKAIRQTLGLYPGTQFQIELLEDKIILEPVETLSAVEALYGKYAGSDFLADLETEHQQELKNEIRA
jgi:AbrB family looped-hinge helix DNA binding protein